jgi:integral membrane protein
MPPVASTGEHDLRRTRPLAWVAFAEATSFLALLVASYLKHQGNGEVGVSILGPIHGGLFIAFVVMVLSLRRQEGWGTGTTAWLLVGAVVPFGGYVVDHWLLRQARAARAA